LLIAALPRILGAFFLPNAFGDAYVYIQEIGTLSTRLSNGSLHLTDLFGFWLPLYQFIAAALNVFVKNGFYSGKIVAALFGAGTCLLVYLVTQRLTANETAAMWMFLLVALNPLHIFYSASAMTDVPHAFFVIAALYFVLTGNWIVAAMLGACAGLTRVESWMLIALIPFLQFIKERRISIVALLILIFPPLFWFYISWKATGNWLECFVQRQQYHDWLLQMNPAIAHFSPANVVRDTATLLVSSDIAVLAASLVAGWFVVRHARRLLSSPGGTTQTTGVIAPVLFFFAFFGLLLVAYLTHQQPIIFPRYGLILFTLGLPMIAWTFLEMRRRYPQSARLALIAITIVCATDAGIQLAGAVGTVNQYRAQRVVADYLREHFDPSSGARIFCDDGTVRTLSGIAENRFVTSSSLRNVVGTGSGSDRVRFSPESFTTPLQLSGVEYLVVERVQGSALSDSLRSNEAPQFSGFESVMHSHTSFLPTDIWLLRSRDSSSP
jgi:hypothetical protein